MIEYKVLGTTLLLKTLGNIMLKKASIDYIKMVDLDSQNILWQSVEWFNIKKHNFK